MKQTGGHDAEDLEPSGDGPSGGRREPELGGLNGRGGVATTAVASLLLSFAVAVPGSLRSAICWLCVMQAVVLLRTCDMPLWHPRRWRRVQDGGAELRTYSIGGIAAALTWVAFPLLFLS